MKLRIVRLYYFYYIEKKMFGVWIKTDRFFNVLSHRRAKSYTNPKTARAAYQVVIERPYEVVETLN